MNYVAANSPKKCKGKFVALRAMTLCGELGL